MDVPIRMKDSNLGLDCLVLGLHFVAQRNFGQAQVIEIGDMIMVLMGLGE